MRPVALPCAATGIPADGSAPAVPGAEVIYS
jgi:hypothetical protein